VQQKPTVFIDFDDTLSDPIPFFTQFARESATLFRAQFGGDQADWERAMGDMLVAVHDDYLVRFVDNPTNGYLDWLKALRLQSMQLLFDAMELPVPPNAEGLCVETQFTALSKCNAAFPGAEQMLVELTQQGYPLHMASGQESEYLRAGLTGLGLAHYFGRLFGPDLVDCAKEGLEYYTRVFEAVGVQSKDVIVVDDYPPAIGWAVASGAKVIQVQLSPLVHQPIQPGIAALVTHLRDLPWQIARIAEKR